MAAQAERPAVMAAQQPQARREAMPEPKRAFYPQKPPDANPLQQLPPKRDPQLQKAP
jgi:hypothetical protein